MAYSRPQYSISLHEDLEADLEALADVDPEAAAFLAAFFEEIEDSQGLLDRLTNRGHVETGPPMWDVDEIQKFRSLRLNLWRLKFPHEQKLKQLRIIYAFHPREFRYYFLGLMPREVDYDPKHPFFTRIEQTYRDLDLPDV